MGHDSELYNVLAAHNTPAQTKAVQDAAYAAQRAAYKASQDGTAADFAELTGLNPEVSSLSPATKTAGSATFTLTVNGFDFDSGAQIRWGGVVQTTTVVSKTQLTTSVAAAKVASIGSYSVSVINGNGKTSNSIPFTVT